MSDVYASKSSIECKRILPLFALLWVSKSSFHDEAASRVIFKSM
jgi:hypothetical protein